MKLQFAHLKKWLLAELDYFSFINTDNFEMQIMLLDLQFTLSCRMIWLFCWCVLNESYNLKHLGLKTVSFLVNALN